MRKTSRIGFAPLILIFLVLIVLGGAFLGYYLTKNGPQKLSYTGPVEKIRIGNVGEYTIFNLIAQDQGFFAQNGLDSEIKEYASGPAAIAGLLANEVDFNIAADFVGVRNIFDHPEIRILAHVNQHRVFQLAVRVKSGIKNPQDLKGKKIGVTKNSAGEYFLGDFLTVNGLSLSDIQMIDLSPPDMLIKLESGEVDGISVFEPHIYNVKKQTKQELIIWEIQGNQNINALVYSTKNYLDANPKVAERYLRALVMAEEYYHANTQKVKDFVGQKQKYEKEYVEYSWPRFTHEVGLQQELMLNLETRARWAIKNGLATTKEVPNYLDYIYFDALSAVKPDSVGITH